MCLLYLRVQHDSNNLQSSFKTVNFKSFLSDQFRVLFHQKLHDVEKHLYGCSPVLSVYHPNVHGVLASVNLAKQLQQGHCIFLDFADLPIDSLFLVLRDLSERLKVIKYLDITSLYHTILLATPDIDNLHSFDCLDPEFLIASHKVADHLRLLQYFDAKPDGVVILEGL